MNPTTISATFAYAPALSYFLRYADGRGEWMNGEQLADRFGARVAGKLHTRAYANGWTGMDYKVTKEDLS